MIELIADKLSIRGPKIDGGYTITFDLGEYMQNQVSELLKLPQNKEIKIIIETNRKGETKNQWG